MLWCTGTETHWYITQTHAADLESFGFGGNISEWRLTLSAKIIVLSEITLHGLRWVLHVIMELTKTHTNE